MSTFIKQTKPGNSIEEVIYFIKSYIPIKKTVIGIKRKLLPMIIYLIIVMTPFIF